jgi:hypothetical protein
MDCGRRRPPRVSHSGVADSLYCVGEVPVIAPSRQQPERELLHVPIRQHLAWRAHPGVVWWHTPSGGRRHKIEAVHLQRMGVKRGLLDILALNQGVLHAIELKNGKAGRISPAQSEMLIALAKAGCRTAVARTLDETLDVLEHWNLIRGDGERS